MLIDSRLKFMLERCNDDEEKWVALLLYLHEVYWAGRRKRE